MSESPLTGPDDLTPSESDVPAALESQAASGLDADRLLARLTRVEAQVRALQDRFAELDQGAQQKRSRGLIVRLALLAILLTLVFLVRGYQAH